ncbi:hypothetical protein VTI74DRAFT_375 [Chaetomium olivicolor]
MASSVPFTVENAHHDQASGPVLYRIRVSAAGAGPTIKYMTAPSRPDSANLIPDFRGELLAFDTVPPGEWNLGHLYPDGNGKFVLVSTETAQLDGKVGLLKAGPAWCDTKVDLIDLLDAFYARRKQRVQAKTTARHDDDDHRTDIQCMNHLSAAILPNLGPGVTTDEQPAAAIQDVIGIWAWQPGHAHGIANESRIYSLIQSRDPGLAPSFLGHITDNKNTRDERVVGFMLERVDDGNLREAGPADLEKCREALERLLRLGIAYPRLRRHSFLVRGDGAVLLQGFGGAFETGDEEALKKSLEELEGILNGPSEMA